VPASILPLFVIVIRRAGTGPYARANERAFPAADQRPGACTDSGADADAFRGLLFPGLRIVSVVMTATLAARDRNCDRKREQ